MSAGNGVSVWVWKVLARCRIGYRDRKPVLQLQPQNEEPCGLLLFPLEVRAEIWTFLSWDDRKSLKQVCKLFEMDINHIVGVEVILFGDESLVAPSESVSVGRNADKLELELHVESAENIASSLPGLAEPVVEPGAAADVVGTEALAFHELTPEHTPESGPEPDPENIRFVEDDVPGPENKWMLFNLKFSLAFPFIKRHVQQDQFQSPMLSPHQRKANWIQSVLPRSLTLRQFSKFAFDPTQLLSKPLTLRCLTIEMDHSNLTPSAEHIQTMLRMCNGLKQLSFTCHAVDLMQEEVDAFQDFNMTVAKEMLCSLQFKRNLTELFMNVKDFMKTVEMTYDYQLRYEGTKVVGQVTHEDLPIEDKWLQRPVRLRKLSLNVVGLPIPELRRWRKFLDGQDRLTHLTLNLGLISWNFFTTVLQKNAESLESLDLVLTNWLEGPVQLGDIGLKDIPDSELFDWHLIAPNAKKLKSLRISTTCTDIKDFCLYVIFHPPDAGWPHDTLNFQLLIGLTSLDKLALAGIHLTEGQLLTIFTELDGLRDVDLESWMLLEEANPEGFEDDFMSMELTLEFMEKILNFCFLLNSVISLNKFDRIKLVDFSLMFYSSDLRQVILNRSTDSDYGVTWPELQPLQWNHELKDDDYFKYPLTIQRK